MVKLLSRFSKNRTHLLSRRNQMALDGYQMLKATLFDSGKLMNGSIIRYDASLSKVGRLYKLMITAKCGNESIRFQQHDFFSFDELVDYLRNKTVFLMTDFKITAIPVIKFDPLMAIMGKS